MVTTTASKKVAKTTTAVVENMTLVERIYHVQQDMNVVGKNRKGHYEYADLPHVWEQVKGLLAHYQVAYTSSIQTNSDGTMSIICTLANASGTQETMQSVFPITVSTPQAVGSAITYYRRYALVSMLNLMIGVVDDDGQEASYPTVQAAGGNGGTFNYPPQGNFGVGRPRGVTVDPQTLPRPDNDVEF